MCGRIIIIIRIRIIIIVKKKRRIAIRHPTAFGVTIIIIIIRNGAKTISLQMLFGRLNEPFSLHIFKCDHQTKESNRVKASEK